LIPVIGGLVPDKLPTLRGDRPWQRSENDGFIDRLLMSFPPEPQAVAENWKEVSEDTLKKMRDVLNKLRTLEMIPVREEQEEEKVKSWRPFVIKLSQTGRQEWQRFTQAHADERNADDFPPHLVGPWSKLRGYAGRLALVLHFLRWACGEILDDKADLDGESMARAVKLVDYFKSHARKVYAIIDADPRVAAARRLLRRLVQGKVSQFTRRNAFRAMRGAGFKTVEDIDPILSLLEEHGYIRPLQTGHDNRPGRKPSPAYETHPSLSAFVAQENFEADEDGDSVQSVQSVHRSGDEDDVSEGEVL
jgi:hypothetical protein